MTKEEIEQIIRDNIKTNGRGEITARVMAGVLESFVAYTDSQADAFEALCRALAASFSALVTEMEGRFETKADALEAAFETFTTDLLENHFEPWAETLASTLTQLMRETKAAALDAKDASLLAKTAAEGASTASGQAKTAAEGADTKAGEAKAASLDAQTKAGDAKDAALLAKTAAEAAETKAGQAKNAADAAASDASDAKEAALLAKGYAEGAEIAIMETSDGLDEALAVILNGNQSHPVIALADDITAEILAEILPLIITSPGIFIVNVEALEVLEEDDTEYETPGGETVVGIINYAAALDWEITTLESE